MGIKLVIVDDAPFIREVIRNIVKVNGMSVLAEAEDGQQAIQVVQQHQPDIVIMDLVMPNKSGIEATQAILKEMPHIKIIACSTMDQETMVLKALEAGCCSYVVKPFQAQDLIKSIEQAVGINNKIQGETE